jgi:ADP-ribose pyrophosphatase YjhB (NUDIX family)
MKIPVPLLRAAYRCAYTLLRVYWFIVRPRVRGALALLIHADQLLLVRNTYGRRVWTLPGGMMKRREDPEAATRREVYEEVGIAVEGFRLVGVFTGRQAQRHDTIHIFTAEVSHPTVRTDPGEILDARWFALADLPQLSTYARRALALWQGQEDGLGGHRAKVVAFSDPVP